MFQPQAKFEFVIRYCAPRYGWVVHVDIDPSEMVQTGGKRKTSEAEKIRCRMESLGAKAKRALEGMRVTVGGPRRDWFKENSLPHVTGDRDIIAFHPESRRCLIAEVEGSSSGQPEQKLYKAIGQIVMAVSTTKLVGWRTEFVLVVYGDKITEHLERATGLKQIGVPALALADHQQNDRWILNGQRPKNQSKHITSRLATRRQNAASTEISVTNPRMKPNRDE